MPQKQSNGSWRYQSIAKLFTPHRIIKLTWKFISITTQYRLHSEIFSRWKNNVYCLMKGFEAITSFTVDASFFACIKSEYIYTYIHIYIYIERERERERDTHTHTHTHAHVYILSGSSNSSHVLFCHRRFLFRKTPFSICCSLKKADLVNLKTRPQIRCLSNFLWHISVCRSCSQPLIRHQIQIWNPSSLAKQDKMKQRKKERS